MSAEKVVKKILAQAETQAAEIKAKADAAAVESAKQTTTAMADYDAKTAELKQKAFTEAKSRVLASARMEIARETLKGKKNLLNEVFIKAAENFKNIADAEYVELMSKLVASCIEVGDEQILTGKNETRLAEDFISKVNAQLGDKGNLTLVKNAADIDAGVIIKKGNVKINVSLAVLLSQAREELETELAKELFNDTTDGDKFPRKKV